MTDICNLFFLLSHPTAQVASPFSPLLLFPRSSSTSPSTSRRRRWLPHPPTTPNSTRSDLLSAWYRLGRLLLPATPLCVGRRHRGPRRCTPWVSLRTSFPSSRPYLLSVCLVWTGCCTPYPLSVPVYQVPPRCCTLLPGVWTTDICLSSLVHFFSTHLCRIWLTRVCPFQFYTVFFHRSVNLSVVVAPPPRTTS